MNDKKNRDYSGKCDRMKHRIEPPRSRDLLNDATVKQTFHAFK